MRFIMAQLSGEVPFALNPVVPEWVDVPQSQDAYAAQELQTIPQ